MNLHTSIRAPGTHVKWLDDWKATRSKISALIDDSPEEQNAYDQTEALSVLLATEQAASFEDLIAQVEWLKMEMETQLISVASPSASSGFRQHLKTVATLRDQSSHVHT